MACIYYQLACCRSCLKAEVPEQCLGLSGYQLVSLSEIILNNILSSLRSTYLCVCYNFDIFLWHIGDLTTWTISNVNKNRIVWHFTPMLETKVDITQFTFVSSVSCSETLYLLKTVIFMGKECMQKACGLQKPKGVTVCMHYTGRSRGGARGTRASFILGSKSRNDTRQKLACRASKSKLPPPPPLPQLKVWICHCIGGPHTDVQSG